MKLRLLAALAGIAFLAGVITHAALAGAPPASWERDNPARCPYPLTGTPPSCGLHTPDPGTRPAVVLP